MGFIEVDVFEIPVLININNIAGFENSKEGPGAKIYLYTPVEASGQYFIKVDQDTSEIDDLILAAIKKYR